MSILLVNYGELKALWLNARVEHEPHALGPRETTLSSQKTVISARATYRSSHKEQQASESLWSVSATKPIAGKEADKMACYGRYEQATSSGGGGDWIARLEQGSGPVTSAQVNAVAAEGLYDYQKEAVRRALERDGRILLAHDMGLGKTVTGLTIMNHYRGDWPLLILCPKAVLTQWAEEVARWCRDTGRPYPGLSEEGELLEELPRTVKLRC